MSTHPDDLQAEARRRVKLKMAFYIHALVFVLVNLGLAAINFASGGHRWHLWPLAGWGLGLAIHGLMTLLDVRGAGLRARMLEAELEHMKNEQQR